ncbi:MAG: T9SS type A sorting domain-containing protein [Chitinophagales bacterium]|nr:T9SS type A sorting domain-containing protein [Chitinophagales bacterium]
MAEPFVRLESALLSAIPLLNDFEIYPNPANNLLSIDLSEEQSLPESVIISDLTGRIFLYHSYDGSSFQSINISGLRAGIYHITLKFRSGCITKTFIKE